MIAAGFGFRQQASVESLRDALQSAATGQTPDVLATVDNKAQSAVLVALADRLAVQILAIPTDVLIRQPILTMSPASFDRFGTGSVAEAAALAAAGPNARLWNPRTISTDRMATCAIAIGAPE